MDFNFSEEQDALRAAVRGALADGVDDRVLDLGDDAAGITDELWGSWADLGWTGLLVPSAHGGLGLGLVDMVVVCEEMGRLPTPGPFWSSAGLATIAARRLGADGLLPDLAAGTARGTVALEEGSARDPFAGLATTATETNDGWTLAGIKAIVPDGHTADWVIVAARTNTGPCAFLVQNPAAEAVPGLDPTRKIARLELTATPARKLTDAPSDEEVLRRIADDAAVLLCAELTGVSERALEMATEYAGQRVQFGRPIGSFQAVKHIAAEMLQQLELARVGAHYAAWASDTEAEDREQAAAMAKAYAGEAAVAVTGDAIQIHGAVGFTWEARVHLLYKRAKVNDLLLGQQSWQRQRVADLVLGPPTG
ncbi:MAG: acyl-CoA dehydrogenase family protein [Nitriliruptorales bacterium]|nr:acyl-CoA dehydrogenase family protein [Nitriliruptorales bacterium]